MIRRFTVTNFQSLRDVDLPLGPLTVIVGPSNSGKSALIRAMRALASNVRGSDVVTRGAKTMRITAQTDGHEVTLTRTGTTGAYQIRELSADGEPDSYTKLAGGVPAAVTRALRIDPVPAGGASLSVAGQLDPPYLLGDSGATVARVLGELTKVDTIFEAVRTANKVRLAASGTLKMRKADLESIQIRLKDFAGLVDRLRAVERAEKTLAEAESRQVELDRLDKALRTLQLAETTLQKASNLPSVPSLDPLNLALSRYLDLKAAIEGLVAKTNRLRTAQIDANAAEGAESELATALDGALKELGVCPTCGQAVC